MIRTGTLFCTSSHSIACPRSAFLEFSGASHRVRFCLDKVTSDFGLLQLKTWFPSWARDENEPCIPVPRP